MGKKKLKNYKINCVEEGFHKELQEIAISLGYYWKGEESYGLNTEQTFKYLFCNSEGVLCYSNTASTFLSESYMEELTIEQFKKLAKPSIILTNITKRPKVKLEL